MKKKKAKKYELENGFGIDESDELDEEEKEILRLLKAGKLKRSKNAEQEIAMFREAAANFIRDHPERFPVPERSPKLMARARAHYDRLIASVD